MASTLIVQPPAGSSTATSVPGSSAPDFSPGSIDYTSGHYAGISADGHISEDTIQSIQSRYGPSPEVKADRDLMFDEYGKQKDAQQAQLLQKVAEREEIAQETANILGTDVHPLDPNFADRSNPFADNVEHQTLLRIKNFLSDSDFHLTPKFVHKLYEVSDFLDSIRHEKNKFDEKLRQEVSIMVQIHERRVEQFQGPELTPVSYFQVPRRSKRLPAPLQPGDPETLEGQGVDEDALDRPPFSMGMGENYYEDLKTLRESDPFVPNSLISNEVDAYLRQDHWDKAEFEKALEKIPEKPMRSAIRRGRQRQLIERALNIHASASEQKHLGQPGHQVQFLPQKLPSPQLPPMTIPLPEDEIFKEPDPYENTKSFLQYREDRKIVQNIAVESTRLRNPDDAPTLALARPDMSHAMMAARIREAVQRLGGPLSAIFFGATPQQQRQVSVFADMGSFSIDEQRLSSLHPLIKFIINQAISCLSWPDRKKIRMIENYLAIASGRLEDVGGSHQAMQGITTRELDYLSSLVADESFEPKADDMRFAQRVINELRAVLIQAQICEDRSRFQEILDLDQRFLDDKSKHFRRADKSKVPRFSALSEPSQNHKKRNAAQPTNVTFLNQMTKEHVNAGIDRSLNQPGIWSFAENLDPKIANSIFFTMNRRPNYRPFRRSYDPPKPKVPSKKIPKIAIERPEPGEGKLFPTEIREHYENEQDEADKARIIRPLRDGEIHAAGRPCVIPFGETPFHEAYADMRIRRDLAKSELWRAMHPDPDNEVNNTDEFSPPPPNLLFVDNTFRLPSVPDDMEETTKKLLSFGVFSSDRLHPAFHYKNAHKWTEEMIQNAEVVVVDEEGPPQPDEDGYSGGNEADNGGQEAEDEDKADDGGDIIADEDEDDGEGAEGDVEVEDDDDGESNSSSGPVDNQISDNDGSSADNDGDNNDDDGNDNDDDGNPRLSSGTASGAAAGFGKGGATRFRKSDLVKRRRSSSQSSDAQVTSADGQTGTPARAREKKRVRIAD